MRRPRHGRILVQGKMWAPLMMIGQEEFKRASKGPFIPHDDVIETLPPQVPEQVLDERILPRNARHDHDLLSAKTFQQATEVGSVAAVAIPHEIRGDGGFGDLKAQLLEFAVKAGRTPQGIGAMHRVDQRADVDCDRRATRAGAGRNASANARRTGADARKRRWRVARSARLPASRSRRVRAIPTTAGRLD